jgi:hypothetical protein
VKRLLLSAVALAVLGGGIVAWQAISQEQAPIEAVQSDEQVTAPPAMSLPPPRRSSPRRFPTSR